MIGALFGIGAAVLIGFSDLFGRRVTLQSSAITSASSMQAFGAISVLVSLIFWPGVFNGQDLALGALSGAGFALGLCCYYLGLTRASSAIVAPLAAVLATLVPFGWAVVRSIEISTLSLGGVAVALCGLVAVTAGRRPAGSTKTGIKFGLLSGLGYGFGQAVLLDVASTSGPIAIAGQRVIAFALMLPLAILTKNRTIAPRGCKGVAVAAGVCAGGASVAFFQGLRFDPIATVIGISLFPVFTVLVGRIRYDDSITKRQLFGIVLAIIGTVGVVAG
jgi:drug/metabolite transporter (DMT)-like permease